MLWKSVGESAVCVDGGQGSFPSPETSMETCKVAGLLVSRSLKYFGG